MSAPPGSRERLAAQVVAAHDAAVQRGEDGYLDPESGLFVMCEPTLRRRERCCGSGCRHCPYS